MQQATQQPKKARNGLAALAQQVMDAPPAAAPKDKKPRTKADPKMLLKIGKIFNPRTNHVDKDATDQGRNPQIANWAALTDYLDSNDGEASYGDIVAALQKAAKDGGYAATDNSTNFVRARVRHGHLVAADAE